MTGLRMLATDPTCECGARARQGYFHLCDANGWPVDANERAWADRPGGQEVGEPLWDGRRVVCSACRRMYDGADGRFLALGTQPPWAELEDPEGKHDVISEEARKEHRTEGNLAARIFARVRRRFGRRQDTEEVLAGLYGIGGGLG